MSPTDVNTRIAREVMGWRLCPKCWASPILRCRCVADVVKHRDEVPDFAGSLDACAIAEAEIERRGLAGKYLYALRGMPCVIPNIEHIPGLTDTDDYLDWSLIRLTPAQRCEAMLKVVHE